MVSRADGRLHAIHEPYARVELCNRSREFPPSVSARLIPAITLFFTLSICAGAQVRITPSTPPGVAAGACFQFTANYPGTWSVTCQGASCVAGTIDTSGRYCAPPVVLAKNQSRGCQLGPNDNIYNVPIDKLPVHPYSSRWLARIATENDAGADSWIYHRFNIATPGLIVMFDNIVDNSTPKQNRHFYYNGPWQDTAFYLPMPPRVQMENGWSQDVDAGLDRHILSINRQTCDDEELYMNYVDFKTFSFVKGNPTIVKFTTNTIRAIPNPLRVYISGATSCSINGKYLAKVRSANEIEIPFDSSHCSLRDAQIAGSGGNCPACNSAGGAHWPVASNALLYGVDAGGSPLSRTSIHIQEWWTAVQKHILDPACNCITLGHAMRTTLTNSDIAPADLWPSIAGHEVTGGHPQIRPASLSSGNPAQFVLSPNECNGQSFIQCFKPCENWTFTIGCKFGVVFGGGTGAWSVVNGKHYVATVTGAASFSIPLNTSGHRMPDSLYFYFDWAPYGARFRLKKSFDIASFCKDDSLNSSCPYQKAILNTLRVYGLILLDGTPPADNWDSNIVSDEFVPDQLIDAVRELNHSSALGFNRKWPAGGGFEQYLEIVDGSSLQVSRDPQSLGLTNYGRVTVSIKTPDHGSSSMDVNLLGTTVGVDLSRISIAAMPSNSYQIHAWVNGNANSEVTYSMSPPVPGASVSSSGVIAPPTSSTKLAKTTVSVCSAATGASDQCAYVDVFFVPVSRDKNIRLWFGGHKPSFIDHNGNTWWGQLGDREFGSVYESADGINFAALNGTWLMNARNWAETPDAPLYAESTSSQNDTLLNIAVPNGTYNLTLYGEPGFGTKAAGQDVFDIEVDGKVLGSYQDGYSLAGAPFHGWTKNFTATVNNGLLEVGGRIREASAYGMSLSSLLIVPAKAH